MQYYKYDVIEAKLIEKKENDEERENNGNNGNHWKKRLTHNQRDWVRIRDQWRCRFNGCRCAEMLEIHHITPSFYAHIVLDWDEKKINSDVNLLTLCHNCHTMIHSAPKIDYSHIVEKQRKEFLMKRPYWRTTFDDKMRETAIRRTNYYLMKHPDDPFPFPTT